MPNNYLFSIIKHNYYSDVSTKNCRNLNALHFDKDIKNTCTQNHEDQSQKSNIINIKLYYIDTFKKLPIFTKSHYLLRLRFTGKLL